MARFLEVDLANTFSRASFVAMGGSPEERGSMAIHILLSGLLKINSSFGIDHIVFCLEGRSWRRKVSDIYKANRDEKRDAMTEREQKEQLAMYSVLNTFTTYVSEETNATVLQHPECEADDFIARFIQLHPADEHIILSSDSDFRQLLSDNVMICDVPNKRYFSNKTSPLQELVKRDREFKLEIEEDPSYYLFKKIIRGDSSDNIMSAYPRVREKGTKNKIGILQAYQDMETQGYDWSNFMNQTWESAEINESFDPYNDPEEDRYIKITNVVKDKYLENSILIDLTKQPDHIIDKMNNVIVESIQREPVSKIGFKFAKFCQELDLRRVSEQGAKFAQMLGNKYGTESL